jgi:hypothetical protein
MLDWISGKKTYIMAAMYGLDAVGAQLGWWAADSVRSTVEMVFTAIFMRMGIAKSGPA